MEKTREKVINVFLSAVILIIQGTRNINLGLCQHTEQAAHPIPFSVQQTLIRFCFCVERPQIYGDYGMTGFETNDIEYHAESEM